MDTKIYKTLTSLYKTLWPIFKNEETNKKYNDHPQWYSGYSLHLSDSRSNLTYPVALYTMYCLALIDWEKLDCVQIIRYIYIYILSGFYSSSQVKGEVN